MKEKFIDFLSPSRNKADRHKSRAPSLQRRTDRQTDRPTDRPTDRMAYRVACTRLKKIQNETTRKSRKEGARAREKHLGANAEQIGACQETVWMSGIHAKSTAQARDPNTPRFKDSIFHIFFFEQRTRQTMSCRMQRDWNNQRFCDFIFFF